MTVKAIPDGFHTVTPYIVSNDTNALMEFLKKAFNGEVVKNLKAQDGTAHAEVKIGNSIVMIGQARGENKASISMFYLYVENCDELYKQAIDVAKAKSIQKPADQFYGDRAAAIEDPDGNHWYIATHKEDLCEEKISELYSSV